MNGMRSGEAPSSRDVRPGDAGRGRRRATPLTAAFALACVLVAGDADAQTIRGRVLDEQDDRPVATALVRLLDASGDERGMTAADSSGAYRMTAPAPGTYRLVAERLGYEDFATPLLEAGSADAVYPLDLLMRRAPIPIPGIEVSAADAERQIRRMLGVSPRALRVRPIHRAAILSHVERAHDLTALIRWSNLAGVVVRNTTDGPCYQTRGRGCLPVYLNGFRMSPELITVIPLDMVHTVLVVLPKEAIQYPTGAVLLYTEAWLR